MLRCPLGKLLIVVCLLCGLSLSVSAQAPINLAEGKPASQSSALPGYSAGFAVDGNTGTLTLTDYEVQPWWQVDLANIKPIQTIQLYRFLDCCPEYLTNFYVLVSNDPFISTDLATTLGQPNVASFYVPGTAGTPTTLTINQTGRYVRVQLADVGNLGITEVEIWGQTNLTLPNFALNKPASQSSTFPGFPANLAVDGDTTTAAITDFDNQPWWQVDLASMVSINTLQLWNWAPEFLSDFYLFVSDVPFTSTDLGTTLGQAGVTAFFVAGPAGTTEGFPTTLAINRTGRYIRVQSTVAGYLAIAELMVLGAQITPPAIQDTIRFLEQSTFGPTPALIRRVRSIGFENFLTEQFATPTSSYPTLPLMPGSQMVGCPTGSPPTCGRDNYTMYPLQTRFFQNALYGDDQLRQRMAWALHKIIVVSGRTVTHPSQMAPYLQTLDRGAFGNFRQLLFEITLNPAMGRYLNMVNNNKTNPNENYAREVLQLFSIGLIKLKIDGTPETDASGNTIPTYDQNIVNNFARVFTGWVFAPPPGQGITNYIDPMVARENQHDTGAKTLLRGVRLPAGQNTLQDLNAAINNIFNDPNVAPFICKQLIQQLVTSNPSPNYVRDVARVFNDNGSGVRGDMRAVARAILLHSEARGIARTEPTYGQLREPALFVTNILRAFNARSADGSTTSDGYLNPQTVTMGQDIFRPASVFSYFPAGYVVPGTTLRGPEFGILSTSTALARANFGNRIVFSRIAVSPNGPTGTSIDLSGLLVDANDPTQLAETLNTHFLHGTMSPEMRNSIVGAVSAVAVGNPLKRARTAVYLVATSSQYQVKR